MVDVLPELVRGLRQRGYTLVNVSTLLRRLRRADGVARPEAAVFSGQGLGK
jgi:hypothetical protein